MFGKEHGRLFRDWVVGWLVVMRSHFQLSIIPGTGVWWVKAGTTDSSTKSKGSVSSPTRPPRMHHSEKRNVQKNLLFCGWVHYERMETYDFSEIRTGILVNILRNFEIFQEISVFCVCLGKFCACNSRRM